MNQTVAESAKPAQKFVVQRLGVLLDHVCQEPTKKSIRQLIQTLVSFCQTESQEDEVDVEKQADRVLKSKCMESLFDRIILEGGKLFDVLAQESFFMNIDTLILMLESIISNVDELDVLEVYDLMANRFPAIGDKEIVSDMDIVFV